MAAPAFNYKTDIARYRHYYQHLSLLSKKPVTQVSAALLFTLGAIIFFSIVAIKPTLETISKLNQKIQQQKEVLAQAEKKVAALSTAQQQYESVATYIPLMDQAIPSDYEIKRLIHEVEAVAGENGIPIKNIRVSDFEYPIPTNNTDEFREINFSISIEAAYPQAKIMLSQLERLPRLMAIKSITMNAEDSRQLSGRGDANAIQINSQLQTYYRVKSESKP